MPAQATPFLDSVILFLRPHLRDLTTEAGLLRSEIIETLASYGYRSRAEMVNAAQILAFGLTTLDTLAESTGAEMSSSMRLRFRGCANGLNRSGQHCEATLAKRLAKETPVPAKPQQDLVDDVPEAEGKAVLQQTQATIDASRARLPTARTIPQAPTTSPTPIPSIIPSNSTPSTASEIPSTFTPSTASEIPFTSTPPTASPIPTTPTLATTPTIRAALVTPTVPATRPSPAILNALASQTVPAILAARTTPTPRPNTGSREEQNKRLWASAMTQVLKEMGMPDGLASAK